MPFLIMLGKVIDGMGDASHNLPDQIPLFPERIRLALGSNINFGTINIELKQPLLIKVESYDLDTGGEREQQIKWSQGWVAERFLFKRCILERNGKEHQAWIYRPSCTPNSIHPYRIEVITEFVPGISNDDTVRIKLENAKSIEAVSF
jgi:CTP-dependent riboflavin kinase